MGNALFVIWQKSREAFLNVGILFAWLGYWFTVVVCYRQGARD